MPREPSISDMFGHIFHFGHILSRYIGHKPLKISLDIFLQYFPFAWKYEEKILANNFEAQCRLYKILLRNEYFLLHENRNIKKIHTNNFQTQYGRYILLRKRIFLFHENKKNKKYLRIIFKFNIDYTTFH